MTTPTPPPTPYDHKPAYDFAAAMAPRCDGYGPVTNDPPRAPYWHAWALVEAYMAGRAAALEEGKAAVRMFAALTGTADCLVEDMEEGRT